MFKNTHTNYGLVSKSFHWLIGLLIIGLIWLGWYMVDLTYFDKWYNESLSAHKALGMVVLALALIKLGWGIYSPTPQLDDALSRWQRLAAKSAHHLLTLMMYLIPLTGYFISISAGRGISMFGWFELPAIVAVDDQTRELAVELHFYLAYGSAAVVLGHIGAALKHQFLDKDGTLLRMLWR